MPLDPASVLKEIDEVLKEWSTLRQASQQDDLSDLDRYTRQQISARLTSTALRFAPPGSHYQTQSLAFQQQSLQLTTQALRGFPGLRRALRDDIANNRLATVTELIHADVFGDFLDMASHVLDQGYKDAAAVIAGSSLEAHLRALCAKHGLPSNDASGRPKKSDALNQDLDKAGAYLSKLDLKSVTAWLDLRNNAAHGHYAKYLPEQVGLMIAGVRDFMTRYPA